MSSACIVDVLYYALLSTNIVLCGQTVRTGLESCAENFNNFFVLPDISGKWTVKYISKSHRNLTVKTTPENSRPYTFCTATLRSICRNYPVNLEQSAWKKSILFWKKGN